MAHLYLSAAHRSSGKTTIAIGICAALKCRALSVQSFKKGPDYIDPIWLSQATERDCHNLDFHTMSEAELLETFARHATDADISIIEGNKGLHDSVDPLGEQSNAALAKLLGAPVVLVIDTRGMTRGIAALLQGFQGFDRDVNVAGVILNQVGGERHESKLRAAVERYTDIPVLGALGREPRCVIESRHLGLVPANEVGDAASTVRRIGDTVATHVDLDRVVSVAGEAHAPRARFATQSRGSAPVVRIGIARDAAFGFYYPGDLAAFGACGAELVPIDTLRDSALPAVDGLFLGGGFPERHMEALEANRALRSALRAAIEQGLPVYAECGGLMYLATRLVCGDRRRDMVGAIDAEVVMCERPQGRGYVRLRETTNFPWPAAGTPNPARDLPAHEFHHSRLRRRGPELVFAYEVLRGHGLDGRHDGIVTRNVLASYAHLRDTGCNHWTQRFVAHVRACRRRASAG